MQRIYKIYKLSDQVKYFLFKVYLSEDLYLVTVTLKSFG